MGDAGEWEKYRVCFVNLIFPASTGLLHKHRAQSTQSFKLIHPCTPIVATKHRKILHTYEVTRLKTHHHKKMKSKEA
jgi:hypothetical protein